MFGETVREDDPYPRHALRRVQPPVPVEVSVHTWLPAGPNQPVRNDVPIWVLSGGLQTGQPVRGLLHGWVLTTNGRWWGIVDITVTSPNQRLKLDLRHQLVPDTALRQLPP